MNKVFHILCLFMIVQWDGIAQPIKEYSLITLMNGESNFVDPDSSTLKALPIWGFGFDEFPYKITLPGPTIYANEGDSVHINMFNPSHEGHTIHLHGLDVDEANDGVPHHTGFIHQGESFKYRFKATHAGNYLYHCHVTTTMHLALGMYGMVIINPADSSKRVYTNGPEYDREYAFLMSEIDSRWNENYTSIGSFLSYNPDLYLINGKNRQSIYQDTNMLLTGALGDQLHLRLLNVGYRVNRVIFPEELEAIVHTSDGRVIEPFSADTLIIYPGERYSVLAEVLDVKSSFVSVDYLDPYKLKFLGRDYIPFNNDTFKFVEPDVLQQDNDTIVFGVGMEKKLANEILLFPNPAKAEMNLVSRLGVVSKMSIVNLHGEVIKVAYPNSHIVYMDLSDFQSGIYMVEVGLNNGLRLVKKLQIQ